MDTSSSPAQEATREARATTDPSDWLSYATDPRISVRRGAWDNPHVSLELDTFSALLHERDASEWERALRGVARNLRSSDPDATTQLVLNPAHRVERMPQGLALAIGTGRLASDEQTIDAIMERFPRSRHVFQLLIDHDRLSPAQCRRLERDDVSDHVRLAVSHYATTPQATRSRIQRRLLREQRVEMPAADWAWMALEVPVELATADCTAARRLALHRDAHITTGMLSRGLVGAAALVDVSDQSMIEISVELADTAIIPNLSSFYRDATLRWNPELALFEAISLAHARAAHDLCARIGVDADQPVLHHAPVWQWRQLLEDAPHQHPLRPGWRAQDEEH